MGLLNLNKFLLLTLAWWITWFLFQSWLIYGSGYSFKIAATDSFISNVMLSVFCTGATFSVRYYRPQFTNGFYVLGGIIVSTALYTWISSKLLLLFFEAETSYINFLISSFKIRYACGLLLMILFVMIGWIIYYLQEQREEDARLNEIKNIAKEAELVNLREQLQPHFLFNTLNSVNALIGINPEGARDMIYKLSAFLRGTLTNEKQNSLTLVEELIHLDLYLSIEMVRFGNRLKTTFQIAEDTKSKKIPAFVLQPLLENAIKFGLYDTLEEVIISVESRMNNDMLEIIIMNPYDKNTSGLAKGTGFGLNSINRKLFLLYGRNDLLTTLSTQSKFTATLVIPQQ